MKRSLCCLLFTVLVAAPAWTVENLPEPLRLPPGLRQTLRINKDISYAGDAVKILDCPNDADNPFGTCGNTLFGGLAMWDSHLSGFAEIRFYPPRDNIAHFEITHPGNLAGDDTIMQAPQLYQMNVRDMFVLDSLSGEISSGDLNLLTGQVTRLNYAVLMSNTWYGDLVRVNPRLKPPAFQFPGIYGSSYAKFEQRPDGLLDVTFVGSTFLPLSNDIKGAPVRIPMPYFGPFVDRASIEANGTSLHPHITWSTKEYTPVSCGARCPDIPYNTVQTFTASTYFSTFGDHFTINVPELGGRGDGRTHLQGRISVQFGPRPRSGNFVPVAVSALPPEGLLVDLPDPPPPLSTFPIKMFGHSEYLRFPSRSYITEQPALLDDGFDFSVGALDVTTGRFVDHLAYRGIPAQSLFSTIILLNITRIPLDTFRHRGPGRLEKGPDGGLVFSYDGNYITNFETFSFPSPDYSKPNEAVAAGPGSELNPFLRLQGMLPNRAPIPGLVKSGGADNLTSSLRETFSYSYYIPCDPSVRDFFFEYTNFAPNSHGGTLRMENLASVSCTNSLSSNAVPGDFDTITFAGYGTWSRDTANGRHIVTVQISDPPDLPAYVSIQIDGATISAVHLKPPEDTIP